MKKILNTVSTIISKILSTLAECIIPTMPIMIGVGMLKVVLIVLGEDVLNILSTSSDTYTVLLFVCEAGYYFMPIFSAISSGEVFKVNKFIAGLIGAMLISPTFVELVNQGKSLTVFGLPIVSTNYGNQIISSIIAVFIMSYISNFLDKVLNENLKPILHPMLTVAIMVPIAFCLIGPLGVMLGNKLVDLIMLLTDIGPLGNAIMCGIIPFITIFGLGGANLSAMLILAASGCDPILFYSNVIYNNVLGFVTLAIYLKNKKPETLAAAITSAIAGASEPALFGYTSKDPKSLFSLCIGCFMGGLMSGIFAVKSYAMASFGIFGIVTTIGPDSSIVGAIIAMVVGCTTGFVCNVLTHGKQK